MMTRAIKGICYRNSFIIYYYFSWFIYVVGMVLFGLVVFFIARGFNASMFFSGCLLWLDGDGVVKIFVILSITLFLEFQVSICIDSLLLKEAFILCQRFLYFCRCHWSFWCLVLEMDEVRCLDVSYMGACLCTCLETKTLNFQWSLDKKPGWKFINLVLIFWLIHCYNLCCIWLLHACALVACSCLVCCGSFVCIY